MLAFDSLVTDLIFRAEEPIDPEVLIETLGGKEKLSSIQIIDPDRQDPRFEMEVSPSIPFRQRGERRILIIDDSVAPMRQDPRSERVVPLDLRPAKEKLLELCRVTPVRFGRLFALGSWGDAVWVARSYRDMRAICLLGWVLDPLTDIDGRRRANPLSQAEFEEKILAYDKRLEELDEDQIKACLEGFSVTEEEDLIVVDLLEEDGSWNQDRSLELELKVAAIDKFSHLPGAKYRPSGEDASPSQREAEPRPAPESAPEAPEPEAEAGPSLRALRIDDELLVSIPLERFDLDVAAALGKGDWESVLRSSDQIEGQDKDRIFRHGAPFVAPVEFLSEVFIDGSPLSKGQFEQSCVTHDDGSRSLDVHFPRFGPVTLVISADNARYVCSKREWAGRIAQAMR